MTVLTTERLCLRPFEDGDFQVFQSLHGDAAMTARMHRGALNTDEAMALFQAYREAFGHDGFGMRAIVLREDETMIGECGLWHREGAGGYTLRYMLTQTSWGQGLTGEAAQAVVEEAFRECGLDTLYAVAMDGNAHSVKALLSLGMQRVEDNHRGIKGFGRYALARDRFYHQGSRSP